MDRASEGNDPCVLRPGGRIGFDREDPGIIRACGLFPERQNSSLHVHERVLRLLRGHPHLEVPARSPAMAIQREHGTVGIGAFEHPLRYADASFHGMPDHVDEDEPVAEFRFFGMVFVPGPGFEAVVAAEDVAGVFVEEVEEGHGG